MGNAKITNFNQPNTAMATIYFNHHVRNTNCVLSTVCRLNLKFHYTKRRTGRHKRLYKNSGTRRVHIFLYKFAKVDWQGNTTDNDLVAMDFLYFSSRWLTNNISKQEIDHCMQLYKQTASHKDGKSITESYLYELNQSSQKTNCDWVQQMILSVIFKTDAELVIPFRMPRGNEQELIYLSGRTGCSPIVYELNDGYVVYNVIDQVRVKVNVEWNDLQLWGRDNEDLKPIPMSFILQYQSNCKIEGLNEFPVKSLFMHNLYRAGLSQYDASQVVVKVEEKYGMMHNMTVLEYFDRTVWKGNTCIEVSDQNVINGVIGLVSEKEKDKGKVVKRDDILVEKDSYLGDWLVPKWAQDWWKNAEFTRNEIVNTISTMVYKVIQQSNKVRCYKIKDRLITIFCTKTSKIEAYTDLIVVPVYELQCAPEKFAVVANGSTILEYIFIGTFKDLHNALWHVFSKINWPGNTTGFSYHDPNKSMSVTSWLASKGTDLAKMLLSQPTTILATVTDLYKDYGTYGEYGGPYYTGSKINGNDFTVPPKDKLDALFRIHDAHYGLAKGDPAKLNWADKTLLQGIKELDPWLEQQSPETRNYAKLAEVAFIALPKTRGSEIKPIDDKEVSEFLKDSDKIMKEKELKSKESVNNKDIPRDVLNSWEKWKVDNKIDAKGWVPLPEVNDTLKLFNEELDKKIRDIDVQKGFFKTDLWNWIKTTYKRDLLYNEVHARGLNPGKDWYMVVIKMINDMQVLPCGFDDYGLPNFGPLYANRVPVPQKYTHRQYKYGEETLQSSWGTWTTWLPTAYNINGTLRTTDFDQDYYYCIQPSSTSSLVKLAYHPLFQSALGFSKMLTIDDTKKLVGGPIFAMDEFAAGQH